MWQFLFVTKKLIRQLFKKCICHTKVAKFCSSTRVNKNCHMRNCYIKIARVNGALTVSGKASGTAN